MEVHTIHELVSLAKNVIVEVDVNCVEKITQNESQFIIDVREPEEFSLGHIKGAINVPRGVLEFRADPSYPGGIPNLYDKTAKITLYCRSGARSALAAQSLMQLGYKATTSMAGGFLAWQAAGLPVSIE